MPKKKEQRKGSERREFKESDMSNPGETDDKCTTKTEFENQKKYSKRPIQKNWNKYDDVPHEDCQTGEDESCSLMKDFSFLIKNASSDCSHFEFNSEKMWQNKVNTPAPSKIFDLDLNVLSSGLACLPFYELIGLDKNELSVDEIARFDKEAEKNYRIYNPIRQKLLEKQSACKVGDKISSKNTELENTNPASSSILKNSEPDSKQTQSDTETTSSQSAKVDDTITTEKITKNPTSNVLSTNIFSNEDNLEDWLDSVLDD